LSEDDSPGALVVLLGKLGSLLRDLLQVGLKKEGDGEFLLGVIGTERSKDTYTPAEFLAQSSGLMLVGKEDIHVGKDRLHLSPEEVDQERSGKIKQIRLQ